MRQMEEVIHRRSRARGLATALAAVLLSGCLAAHHIPYESGRIISPNPTVARPSNRPATPSEPLEYSNHTEPRLATRSHRVRRIEFDSTGDNGQPESRISALYYESRAPGAKRLVVVLPIWGASTYPSNKITRSIVRRMPETNVFRLLGEERLLDWEGLEAVTREADVVPAIERIVHRLEVAVADVGRIIDWAVTRPEIDSERIGIVGFSAGALVASIAAAQESRLAAAVVVMGAADLHDVVTVCYGRRERAREHILTRFGWGLESYREAFRAAFEPLDASYQHTRVDPRRILMIDAEHDSCMPADTRDSLWRRLGRPERITYRYDHRQAFLAMTPLGMNRMRRQIRNFLDQALSTE